jgi:hypothetical protein
MGSALDLTKLRSYICQVHSVGRQLRDVSGPRACTGPDMGIIC